MAKQLTKFAHPDFLDMLPDYVMIRDCFKGARAIKEAGELYLPKLKGQTSEDYNNYRSRALFFPIAGKTTTTMVGLATIRPPKCVYPTTMEMYFSDTEREYQFTEFYVSVFTEIVLMGRYGVLIDAPDVGESDPTLSPYIAENIVRWDVDDDGMLVELLLREFYLKKGAEKFQVERKCRYRHCYINNGVYTVETLDDDLESDGTPPVVPSFSGQNLSYIPFVFIGSSGVHASVDKPPMLDISTINVSHYMSSADLEWGRHITGLPTPVVSGVDASTKLTIGGTAAWVLPPADAKAYYMEFQGQGLKSLETAMSEKISLMASVSARLIDSSSKGSEAAETVRLRYMSESASLTHIITAVESGLNMVYNMLSKLMKANGDVSIVFSREVLGVGIAFKDLKVLFEAYFQGCLSKESLLYNLRRLEALDPNRSDADELAAIREPSPATTQPAVTPPGLKPAL